MKTEFLQTILAANAWIHGFLIFLDLCPFSYEKKTKNADIYGGVCIMEIGHVMSEFSLHFHCHQYKVKMSWPLNEFPLCHRTSVAECLHLFPFQLILFRRLPVSSLASCSPEPMTPPFPLSRVHERVGSPAVILRILHPSRPPPLRNATWVQLVRATWPTPLLSTRRSVERVGRNRPLASQQWLHYASGERRELAFDFEESRSDRLQIRQWLRPSPSPLLVKRLVGFLTPWRGPQGRPKLMKRPGAGGGD